MRSKVVMTLALSIVVITGFGDTCPTQLHQEYDGHWVSTQAPGWKTAGTTGLHTLINTNDFGGAVYSPTQKRLACVYRRSDGFWIALISHTHKGFQIDKHALDDARSATAWHFDKKHHDYTCGRPTVTKIKNCLFSVNS